MQVDSITAEAEALVAPAIRGGLAPSAARLFRVYRTMAHLLEQRGYMVPKSLREITPAQFQQKFGNDSINRETLTLLVEKADDEHDQLFVFFPEDEKVGVKPIKVYTDRMRAEGSCVRARSGDRMLLFFVFFTSHTRSCYSLFLFFFLLLQASRMPSWFSKSILHRLQSRQSKK